ncbi:hypothetical protein Thiowin_01457 [Thiorhodovibrio winogradskyi]|uniref:Uncharacterized protein n=1 Tax=Thiorhodovibrio winogradskyi TaxID=77007 RepID=A0ABZ0S8C5_9GAMM
MVRGVSLRVSAASEYPVLELQKSLAPGPPPTMQIRQDLRLPDLHSRLRRHCGSVFPMRFVRATELP